MYGELQAEPGEAGHLARTCIGTIAVSYVITILCIYLPGRASLRIGEACSLLHMIVLVPFLLWFGMDGERVIWFCLSAVATFASLDKKETADESMTD